MISVVSFGFRYGVPADADLVFDVRFLPNPHFVQRLRPFTRQGSARGALHSLVSRKRAIPAPHRKLARLFDSALHPRGQELSDCRPGMYGRPAPVGRDGRGDSPRLCRKRIRDQSRAPRSGQDGVLTFHAVGQRLFCQPADTEYLVVACKGPLHNLCGFETTRIHSRPLFRWISDLTMDAISELKHRTNFAGCCSYLRPYAPLLVARHYLMAVHGSADGLAAFAIRPALDVVLNPHSTVQKLDAVSDSRNATRRLLEFVCSFAHSSRVVRFRAGAAVSSSWSRASPNFSAAP